MRSGTGTQGWNRQSNQTRLGFQACVDLLCYAYDRGIRFIDSADMYGSHPHVAAAAKVVGRENLTITTKTVAKDLESAKRDIPRIFRELETDYVDILLLHCMTTAEWPERMRPVMDYLSEWKEQGRIRALGVSCHHFGAFERAAEEPWVDVVLARINFDGVHMDERPEHVIRVLRRMHEQGKGIYGMKVVGQKQLASEWRQAIKFVFDLDCVHAMTIGMESREEVDRNVDYINSLFESAPPGSVPLRPERPGLGGTAQT
ncbi:MAG: hypothetical protein KatS3mg115_1312 [Candidatus Poribacteria bacterium]|nr:MAG: hypothetical protein KatS3mg115_1312 [Candidatus Poribacteria bacterium]